MGGRGRFDVGQALRRPLVWLAGLALAMALGAFSDWRKSPMDRGYTLKSAVAHLRSLTKVPILTGLPFGHVPTKVCLPVGARVTLAVQGRDAFVGW